VEEYVSAAVLHQLHTLAARHAYNTSGMGRGLDIDRDDNDADAKEDDSTSTIPQFQGDQVRDCCKTPLSLFCNHLIEHFDILFQQNKLLV